MSRRIAVSSKELSPRIIGPLGEYRPARVQSLEIRGNFPTRDIEEHGNNQLAGIVNDIPEYTVTMGALDVSTKIFAALTGTADPYPASGVSINALAMVDIAADYKDAALMDYVKAEYITKARVQSARFSYTVNGDSTEEYTFGASSRRTLRHDVIVDSFDAASASPVTLTQTPEVLKNGNYALAVMLDGDYLVEVADSPATGEYSVSGTSLSFADTVTSKLVVAYKADPAGTNWSWVSDATIPAAIAGKDVPVEILANSIPRVQSVSINVDLRADTIKEMGNTEIVGYVYQIPQVTGDISVLDTDHELIALLSTGDIASTDTEFVSCELLADNGLDLTIKMRDPSDPCSASGTVLKTVKVPGIQITGESKTSNVGNNVTQTFNWRSTTGDLIIYSGAAA